MASQRILLAVALLTQSPALLAHPGIGIVMDDRGNVYYTDLEQVWRITPEGERTVAVPDVHTHQLYLDAAGALHGQHEWYEEATDTWGYDVWRLGRDGELRKTVPDVQGNNTLVRDPAGNTYWSSRTGEGVRVMVTDTAGWDRQLTRHRFRDIRWMHWSTDRNTLLVVDHLQVKEVGAGGAVTTIGDGLKEEGPSFGGVADRHYVFGTWTDRVGSVYVAVYGAGKVRRIDRAGRMTTVYTAPEGWSPCGGLVAPDGALWVMEFSQGNRTRVMRVG